MESYRDDDGFVERRSDTVPLYHVMEELKRQATVQEEMRKTLHGIDNRLVAQETTTKEVSGKVAAFVSTIISAIVALLVSKVGGVF